MEHNTGILCNGTLVFPTGCRKGNLVIRKGRIAAIVDSAANLPAAENRWDASGLFVFPGMIDSHTHMRGESFSYREDFYSGSCAAAAGGVTTFLEMPGSAKPASTLRNFLEKLADMQAHIGVDAALYAGAGYDNLEEIPQLAAAGAIGFKTFLMPPVPGREKEFYGMCAGSEDQLVAVMRAVARTGLTLTLHCEENAIIQQATEQVRAQGGGEVRDYCAARPAEAEIEAVRRTLNAAAETGCRVNIAHVSTPEAAELIAQAREAGLDVAGETCAHYLTFDSDQMDGYGAFARMKPPFRDRSRVNALQTAYAKGKISYTGSDHAPFTPEEKLSGGSIWQSYDGLAGIEMTLPLLLELAAQGILTYETIARNGAENAARRFGLRNKGAIAVGADADLVLVRRCAPRSFHHSQLHSKHTESGCIYEGLTYTHEIVATIRRGAVIYQNKTCIMAPGSGHLILSGGR